MFRLLDMPQEAVDRLRSSYWVLQPPYPGATANPYDWVFSPTVQPYPVINRNMPWRRPTFEECLIRQAAYDENPAEFCRRAAERSQELHRYVAMAERDAQRQRLRLLSEEG